MTMYNEKIYLGKKDGFNIYFEAFHTFRLDYNDLNLDESIKQSTIESLTKGDLVLFNVIITAEKEGLKLGTESLGDCIYKTIEEFYTTYKNEYCLDMIETATQEAKETINKLTK